MLTSGTTYGEIRMGAGEGKVGLGLSGRAGHGDLWLHNDGKVGIGCYTPGYCLTVAGTGLFGTCVQSSIVCSTNCMDIQGTQICETANWMMVNSGSGFLIRVNNGNRWQTTASGTTAFCNMYVCGSLSKASGCFSISHPDPAKNATHNLQHAFVESPTEGDNIYRWQVQTTAGTNVITLPTYYRFLNKNDMVWVSPYRNFGSAYGEVTADQCCLIVCSNQDGCYNVLLIGTRKDEHAESAWTGAEVLKPENNENAATPVHGA
jgi:hypothetical protein